MKMVTLPVEMIIPRAAAKMAVIVVRVTAPTITVIVQILQISMVTVSGGIITIMVVTPLKTTEMVEEGNLATVTGIINITVMILQAAEVMAARPGLRAVSGTIMVPTLL